MYQYELPKYFPTADELPCSDDTPVDEDWSRRFPPAKEVRNELQELIPSLLKSILQMLLYWYDENSQRYPTPYERADRLAAKLRALGIDPEAL